MKKVIFLLVAITLQLAVLAQGNSGKNGKDKNKSNVPAVENKDKSKGNSKQKGTKPDKNEHDQKVWDGISGASSDCMKPSKNQPAKVRAAFQRDYPNASNVQWTKCRGDWTATFNHSMYRSTAVYHANGERRDTRTFTKRENLPVRIQDVIKRRMPGSNPDGGIRIEVPNMVKDIFRIKNIVEGKPQYLYLDVNGDEVQYNY